MLGREELTMKLRVKKFSDSDWAIVDDEATNFYGEKVLDETNHYGLLWHGLDSEEQAKIYMRSFECGMRPYEWCDGQNATKH
jgi:hypothetical protein